MPDPQIPQKADPIHHIREEDTNPTDSEFAIIEELEPIEAAEFIPMLVDETFCGYGKAGISARERGLRRGNSHFTRYVLPDIPSSDAEDNNIDTIRESYDSPFSLYYRETARRKFLRLDQGVMYRFKPEDMVYAFATMSECSLIVAVHNGEIIVSHISYSTKKQVNAVYENLTSIGVQPENIHVLASIGDYQTQRDTPGEPRITEVEEWSDYPSGHIPGGNIKTFEYKPGDSLASEPHTGLVATYVTPQGIYLYEMDMEPTSQGDEGIFTHVKDGVHGLRYIEHIRFEESDRIQDE